MEENEAVENTRDILIVPFCPRLFVRPPLSLPLRPAAYFFVRPAGSKRLDSTGLEDSEASREHETSIVNDQPFELKKRLDHEEYHQRTGEMKPKQFENTPMYNITYNT